MDRVVETSSGTDVREYVYGVGIDEVILEWLPDGSQKPFWPLTDSLGTVRDLADLDGSNTARLRMGYDIDAWGNLTGESTIAGSSIEQDVLFTGRWLDRETVNADSYGLYHYRAREYDPELGRFLQRDPIGVWGDVYSFGNGFAYVGNDPINGVDPDGEWGFFVGLFIAAVAIAVRVIARVGPQVLARHVEAAAAGLLAGVATLGAIQQTTTRQEQRAQERREARERQQRGEAHEKRCERLSKVVEDLCHGPDRGEHCVPPPNMSCPDLLANQAKFQACVVARKAHDDVCWEGGDPARAGGRARQGHRPD